MISKQIVWKYHTEHTADPAKENPIILIKHLAFLLILLVFQILSVTLYGKLILHTSNRNQ